MRSFSSLSGLHLEDGQLRLQNRTIWLLLGALLLWSLALRLWFGSIGLNVNRFWDERYGLQNIAALLHSGSLRPANGFHPSLSYLPQALLLGASQLLHKLTGASAFAIFAQQGFTGTAYLLCRVSQALLGTLSIYLTFLVGRRLAGPRTGLLAALFLSAVPWHIRQSAIFKPDILLVATALLAFYLSLRAAERPSLRAYALAGAAIGLALSSKFNAGPVAIPLVVAALLSIKHEKRVLLWLLAAGGCSLAVFLLLNPYALIDPDIYRRSMGRTLRDYARKGFAEGRTSHLDLPFHAVRSLMSPHFHGQLIAGSGFAGALAATLTALRDLGRSPKSVYWLMSASFVVGYVVLYSLSTTNPSAHNWLPLAPFVAINAAWLLGKVWELLVSRWSILQRATITVPVMVALALMISTPANTYAYKTVVPSTAEIAGHVLRAQLSDFSGRLVFSEVPLAPEVRRRGPSVVALVRNERLDAVDPRELNRGDGELFLEARLAEPESAAFYRRRLETQPAQIRVISPAPFRAWGPALVFVLHPWVRFDTQLTELLTRERSGSDLFDSEIFAASDPREMVSIELWLPAEDERQATGEVIAGDRILPLIPYRVRRRKVLYLSPRFLASEKTRVRIYTPEGVRRGDQFSFVLHRWQSRGWPPTPSTGSDHDGEYEHNLHGEMGEQP